MRIQKTFLDPFSPPPPLPPSFPPSSRSLLASYPPHLHMQVLNEASARGIDLKINVVFLWELPQEVIVCLCVCVCVYVCVCFGGGLGGGRCRNVLSSVLS